MLRVKVINSHTGLSRFLAECSDEPVAWLARRQTAEIPSPYRYSPSCAIYKFKGRSVVWFETRHKRYEVFEVPKDMQRFKSDDEATDYHVKQ